MTLNLLLWFLSASQEIIEQITFTMTYQSSRNGVFYYYYYHHYYKELIGRQRSVAFGLSK